MKEIVVLLLLFFCQTSAMKEATWVGANAPDSPLYNLCGRFLQLLFYNQTGQRPNPFDFFLEDVNSTTVHIISNVDTFDFPQDYNSSLSLFQSIDFYTQERLIRRQAYFTFIATEQKDLFQTIQLLLRAAGLAKRQIDNSTVSAIKTLIDLLEEFGYNN